MTIVEQLLEAAKLDTDLLLKNDANGDSFEVPRRVDFLFLCDDRDKAELVASFLSDVRYGNATVSDTDDAYRVLLQLDMPVTQNVLCAVSGVMVCVANMFSVQYDGWGCVLQKAN